MSDQLPRWKRLNRKAIYDTKYLKLYEDTVEFPDGTVADDYSVATVPDGVVVVATDETGALITLGEYKYAIDKTVLNFPAGSFEPGEEAIDVARRELREEAGYESDEIELVNTLYSDYPSKLTHRVFIVRAKNAHKVMDPEHEPSETIGQVRLITSDMQEYGGEFDTTYTVSALALTLPDFLKKSN